MSTRLELHFSTGEGKSRTLAVNNPILDLEPTDVQAAMETISAQELFEQEGTPLYESVKGARYVTRTVADIFTAE